MYTLEYGADINIEDSYYLNDSLEIPKVEEKISQPWISSDSPVLVMIK